MPTSDEHDAAYDDRLAEAVARFLQSRESGAKFDKDAWLTEFADVAEDLKEFLETDARMQSVVQPSVAPDQAQDRTVVGTRPQEPETPIDRFELYDDGPPPVGTTIGYFGDYELLEEIGRGGMGVIYRARQCTLNRIVAVKMILAGDLASDEDIRRFQLEAEAAATLDHPGIVPIFEVGDHDGQPYFSMAYVPGTSLADELRDGPLPPRRAAEIIKSVAEAVDYAHKQGIIHRDLKPGNVLLDREGNPRVTDFGLAKRVRQSDKVTASGQILGTPSYMPPEQATADPRQVRETADIYALGAVLYAMLTGRPPFQADNPLDTLSQVVEQEPIPPRRINPKIPRDLETVCLKCLEKARRRRYQFARNLASDLGRFLNGEPVEARPISATSRVWRWCQRRPLIASLMAMLFISLTVGLYASTYFAIQASRRAGEAGIAQGKAERNTLAASKARLEAERMATRLSLNRGLDLCERGEIESGLLWLARALETVPDGAGDLEQLIRTNLGSWRERAHPVSAVVRLKGEFQSFSSDGEIVLTEVQNVAGNRSVAVWLTSTGEQIGEPLEIESQPPTFLVSGDNSCVAGLYDNGKVHVWRAPFTHAVGRELRHSQAIERATLSDDGSLIVTADEQGSCRAWNTESGQEIGSVWRLDGSLVGLAISANSRFVATLDDSGTLRVQNLSTGMAGGSPQSLGRITGVSNKDRDLLFLSRDGAQIAARVNGTVHVFPFANGQVGDEKHQIGDSVRSAFLSIDGSTLVTSHSDRKFRRWDWDSGKLRGEPMSIPASRAGFSLSDDGLLLLATDRFSGFTSSLGQARLWSVTTGKPLSGSLVHNETLTAASLTGDGKRMMTVSDGTLRTWAISHSKRRFKPSHTLQQGGWVFSVAFSPDDRLLLTGCTDATAQIWDIETGTMVGEPIKHSSRRGQLVHRAAFDSTGGRFFTASHDGTVRFWNTTTRQPIGKPFQHRTKPGGLLMVWSAVIHPEGRLIATGTGTGGINGKGDTSVRLWEIETGNLVGGPIRLGGGIRGIAFSPNGKRFATACMDGTAQLWDTATQKPIGPPMRHKVDVRSIAISPDGSRILTGCEDGLARFWDMKTQQQVGRTLEHQAAISAVAYSAEGQMVATAGHDSVVRLWDATTGQPIGEPLKHRFTVLSLAFNSDGKRLATGSSGRLARIWTLRSPVDESSAEITQWAEITTGLTLDEHGTSRSLTAAEWQKRKLDWESKPSATNPSVK